MGLESAFEAHFAFSVAVWYLFIYLFVVNFVIH